MASAAIKLLDAEHVFRAAAQAERKTIDDLDGLVGLGVMVLEFNHHRWPLMVQTAQTMVRSVEAEKTQV